METRSEGPAAPGAPARLAAHALGLAAGGALSAAALLLLSGFTGLSHAPLGGLVLVAGALLLAHPIAARILAPGALERDLPALLAFQVAAFLTALLVPFGFDRPSALGLDFAHLLALGALYGVAAVLGALAAARQRRWKPLAFQLVLPALFVLLAAAGVGAG
jgi:hypothetical protein